MFITPDIPANRSILLATLGVALLFSLTACDALGGSLPTPTAHLTVSTDPGGSGAVALSGAVLYGSVFVHAKASETERASFYLDDQGQTRPPYLVLSRKPWRLNLDTRTLPDGPHTLTLELSLADGESHLSHTAFTVNNAAGEQLEYVNLARAGGYDCGSKGTFAPAAGLKLESRLITAAQKHADDMNEHGYFSHTGQDGSSPSERVTREGYSWSKVGENLAQGYTNTSKVVAGWLESDGHCANLMNPAYTELGVGKSGDIWVQVFARP